MAKKKNNINIILVILAIAVSVFLLNYFGVFDKLNVPGLATVPVDCPDGSLCKTEVPPYQCPSDVNFCLLKGRLYCESPTNVQLVTFRSNALSSLDYNVQTTWIAFNNVVSGNDLIATENLNPYCYSSTISSTSVDTGKRTPQNNIIGARNGQLHIFTDGVWRQYVPCEISSDLLDNKPLEPYTSNDQEIALGNKPYTCGSTFETYNLDGTLKEFETIEYSSSVQGYVTTGKTFRLESNEIADFNAGTYSKTEVLFNTYLVEETCTRNYCQGNGYVQCVDGKPGDFVTCEYGCSNGKCIEPYNVEISLRDERGFERTSFGKDDLVKIYVRINSNRVINGQLTLDLREGSIQGTSYDSRTVDFTSNTDNIFEYTIPITGDYFIILKIDYPELNEPEFYGTKVGEIKSFEIVDEFTATLKPSQTLGGVQNLNKFYTGYPIKIDYIFKEPGDTPVLPDSAIVTYQIGSGSKVQLTNPTISQDDFAGYYTYYFTPTQPGVYKFEGIATKGSFTTNPSIKGPYSIEKDSIVVEYVLSYNPVQVNKLYNDILKFTTRNRDKKLIETNNIVKLRINGIESGTVPVKGSGGQYSIDYTFTQNNADYLFIIESTPLNEDMVRAELSTELIKAGESEDIFCKSDSECGFLSVCNEGNCETNINLVVSLIIGLGVLILIIVVAYKFIKNKKKKPSFGGDL